MNDASLSQGMNEYTVLSTLNKMFSSGTRMAKEKMLNTALRMFSTTEPAR